MCVKDRSPVVTPYAEYAADLCDGLSVYTWSMYTQSSSFLHEDVRFYPVNHLTDESNFRMPVFQNGSDGAHLPAFNDAILVQRHRRSTAARRSGILVLPIPKSTSLAHLSSLYASQLAGDEKTPFLPFGFEFAAGLRPPRCLVAIGFNASCRTSQIPDKLGLHPPQLPSTVYPWNQLIDSNN